MSLFKSREWWAVNLNENELYDSQSLLITTLGDDKYQSILIGNHTGTLRLFSPNSEPNDRGVLSYEPSHLLLEVHLGSPILQIKEGALVSASTKTYLGILHPRLFSVYGLKKKESKESNIGDQMEIELAYQHVLRHSAHSFVIGPFGGVSGRSFICIQSLDGLLSFYEQESFAFQLYLSNFILPFSFAYLEKMDSFLFLNGLLIFECYSYEALASTGSSNEKKIVKSWEYNLGEKILDINTINKDDMIIVILTERSLLGLNGNGKLMLMKRLEFSPIAFCCYLAEESRNLMIVMATDGGFVNLYEDVNLKWSMKIDQIPVCLKRIFTNSLPGGIVLLSEDGLLQVVYIGTHPSVYLVPLLVQPEIDIRKAELELKNYQQKIADNDVVDAPMTDLVGLSLKVDKNIEVKGDVKSCNLMLEINIQCLITKIQILFIVEYPLVAKMPSVTFSNCSEKTFLENSISVQGSSIASSLLLQVIVTYVTGEGIVRSFQRNAVLPLELVVVEAVPVKESQNKITITTNKPVCGMNHLFKEVTSDCVSSNAIGFKLNSGDIVSILAAKSSQRYRLQCNSWESATIILQALLERLNSYFQKDSDFTKTYSSPLPLDDFFQKISTHQDLIKKRKTLEGTLKKQTSQFIEIQKKVLTNLKDATPKPSSNLCNILKDTSKMIKSSIKQMEEVEEELQHSRIVLRSMNRFMMTLLELMSISKEDLKILKIAFNPHIQDTEDHGWLEVQEGAMSFLLRTVLAKSVKDQQKAVDIFLEPMTDTTKLNKHFKSVIDRVTKGSYLFERNDFEGKKEPLVTIQAAYESDEGLIDEVNPISSKLLKRDPKIEKQIVKPEIHKEENGLPVVHEVEEKKEVELVAEKKSSDHQIPLVPILDTKYEREEEVQSTQKLVSNDSDDDDGIWDIKVKEMRI